MKASLQTFFLCLLLLYVVKSGLIPESSFTVLSPYEQKQFSIFNSSEIKEAYFVFDNSHDDSDLVINFAKGTGYTTYIYVYANLDDIQKEKEEYKNEKIKQALTSKRFILSKETFTQKGKIYFVIMDVNGYQYNDYITMYNEVDVVALKNDIPITFNFFSKKIFESTFTKEANEAFEIKIRPEEKGKAMFLILYYEGEKITEQDISDFTFKYQYDKKGEYKISITETKESDSISNIYLLLSKPTKTPLKLLPNSKNTVPYLGVTTFFFYAEITNYISNENGIITLSFTNPTIQGKHIETYYATQVETDDLSEENIKQLMPIKKDLLFEFAPDMDNVYHVYFQRPKEETTKHYLVLISLTIRPPVTFTSPVLFDVTLTPSSLKKTITEGNIHNIEEIELLDYVPSLIEITIPKTNPAMTYIMYTSEPFVMTYYNGTILLSGGHKLNTYSKETQIVVYNQFVLGTSFSVITIKLFGQAQKLTFHIETTNSDVAFYNKFRPTKTFTLQLTDCSKPYYIIGNYESSNEGKVYLEEIFGNAAIGYKNFEALQKDAYAKKSIFPDINEYNTTKFSTVMGFIDIFSLQCIRPGYFKLYFLYYQIPNQIEENAVVNGYLNKASKNIQLPKITEEKDSYVEVISPLGKQFTITIGDKVIELDSNTKKYDLKVEKSTAKQIDIESKEDDNLIQVKLTTDSNYEKIIDKAGKYEQVSSKFILIKLDNLLTYQSVNINLNTGKNYTNYYSFLGRMPNSETNYIEIPQRAYHDEKYFNLNLDIKLTNPYDKYPQNSIHKSTDTYYYAIELPKKEITDITVEYIAKKSEEIEIAKKDNVTIIDQPNTRMIIEKSDTDANLNIIYRKCGNTVKYDVTLSYYDTILSSKTLTENITAISSTNYNIDTIIDIKREGDISKFEGLTMSYFYKNDINIDELNTKLNKQYKIEYNSSLQWEEIPNVDHYELYYQPKNSNNTEYMDNECYLTWKRQEPSMLRGDGDNDTLTYVSTNTTSYKINKEGNYTVNVIAVIMEGESPIKILYGSVDVSLKKDFNWKLLLYIGIGLIGGILLAVGIVLIVKKAKKSKNNISIPQETEGLIRDTGNL